MQHKGRLTGLSSQLGQRARTNSEQLLAVTRTTRAVAARPGEDPHHARVASRSPPASGRIDARASSRPYWGVGSNVFAFLVTYHQHGEQKHPTASWLKELVEHPAEVLGFDDPRHWSERTFVALCMQTTDTSIELYWHDGLLRSRPSGTPPSVHIPVDRGLRRPRGEEARQRRGGARDRGHQPQRLRALRRRDPDRREQRERRRRSLPARVRPAGPARHGRQRDAGQPRREPVAHDHGAGRARDVALAQQGRRGHSAPAGLRLRACRPGHAAPPVRAGRRPGRAAARRQEVRRHPRVPVLKPATKRRS